MALCSICGEELTPATVSVLKCAHEAKHAAGEPKVGSAILGCPLKKGAIWVYVVDEAGKGVKLVPVTVPESSPKAKPSDPLGFSSFDPLDEGSYTVEIELPSEDDYITTRRSIANVPVHTGEITSVQIVIERVAPLKVTVDHPENFPGKLDVEVVGAGPESSFGKGFLNFAKLKKSDYTVKYKLSEEQAKKFVIDGQSTRTWPHDPYGVNEVPFKVIPLKLIKLEVTGAKDLGNDHHWCVADPVKKVRVKAITEPNDERAWSQLNWEGATKLGNGQEAEVDITSFGDLPVKATLDVPKKVTIEVYDLDAVTCPLPKVLEAGKKWKAYASNTKVTRLKVTTKPDEERVWKHLTWSAGTATPGKNECDVELKPVGDKTVNVSLEAKSLPAILHICQWPVLEIFEVGFECHEIWNDGAQGRIAKAFDKKWKVGRPEPITSKHAPATQSPICFTRNKKIKVGGFFKVTTLATEDETVKIKGALGFSDLEGDITVQAGKGFAMFGWLVSPVPVPNKVDCQDAWKIDWTHALEDGTMADAKSSTHQLYVLLGDPNPSGTKLYYTLVDMSCRFGKDKTTENEFVLASFKPFKDSVDDNKGYPRKGDGLKMSYYKQGVKTAADDNTYTTEGILSGPDATGRCGGWASFLIHMWSIHGVIATQRWFIRSPNKALLDDDQRFLVKNCNFTAIADLTGLYTHTGTKDRKADGAAGQGKKNPQFDFSDHVVVKHGGKLYDPSYGMGPYDDDKTYLSAALDGLGSYATGKLDFKQTSDNTKQHIPKECVPYTKGFADFRIGPETFADVAKEYGITPQKLLDADMGTLKATYGTPDMVPAGVTVIIPTNPTPTHRKIKTDQITST